MKTGNLKIHSENILPIIKKWLYSDKDIFVRELVSNSCDALKKLQILRERGELAQGAHASDETFRINVRSDSEKKTLHFSDNGVGMDAEEVENYIAQIAFSGAEDFLKKYKSDKEEDQIIGHFGLGFYSSYMVAKKVEIQTRSYRSGSEAVFWSCDGSSTYEIAPGERSERGTEVILHLQSDEEEYLDPVNLRKILDHYCAFLPFPIYFNGSRINEKPPLWIKLPTECTEKEYLDFYHHLFPQDPSPLFWIHLNVDYPFHLKGILYFPKIQKEGDLKKESIKLFCNRVFVSDNCKDLLPEYLTVLRGAIDSPDIPLNVSRSYLQLDRTVRQLGSHISKKITDRLSSLFQSERDKFLSYWEDLEVILKFGALHDEKFYERVQECLIWKNSLGEWTTAEEYLVRNREKNKETIYYAAEENNRSHLQELLTASGVEILYTRSLMLDQAIIHLIERKTNVKFQRIDAGVNEALLDAFREKTLLDAEGKTERMRIADFVRTKLDIKDLKVDAKSLTSDHLPGFLMMSEEERRFRDSLAYQNPEMLKQGKAFLKPTFIVNTNSKLIAAIQRIDQRDPDLAKELLAEVYDLARLGQKEMDPEELSLFIQRSTSVLERLASHIS